MKHSSVLAIDIGTSSVRAALYDFSGRRVPRHFAQRTYQLKTAVDGTAELDPHVLLRQLKACLKAAQGSQAISAVGVSCFWHSLLGTDAQGNPLTPIYTWADSRSRADAAKLREEFSERSIHTETGCMLRTSYWPAKLRWLRRTNAALFRRVHYWMSPGEWVQWQIAGRANCAHGMATGTGLYDPSRLQRSARLLKAVGLTEDHLLPLDDSPALWRDVPWFPAVGDGAASNLGSGADRPGVGAINVGTSAALRIMKKGVKAHAPFGLFAYRVDTSRYLVGGAISNAGSLFAWCGRELRTPSAAVLEKQLAQRPTPEHGLTVLPFWSAERAPSWDDEMTGAIHGMRQNTTATDLVQATQEASYLRLALIANLIGGHPQWIVAGGILHSPSAVQRLANVLGDPLTINPDPEASLRGAAIFALEKLAVKIPDLKFGRPIKPAAAVHRVYRAAGERQLHLEKILRGGR